MRILWKGLLTLPLLLLFAFTIARWKQFQIQLDMHKGVSESYDAYRVGIGYVIEAGHWTMFPIPPGSAYLRTIINGTVPAQRALLPDERVHFDLEYSFLDQQQNQLYRGIYHFADGLSHFVAPGGASYPANLYEIPGIKPLDRRKAVFSLDERIRFVQFRLLKPVPGLNDVLLRAYLPTRLTPGREPIFWARKSRAQKLKLTEASILDFRLLTPEERATLVRQQWRPIGPTGIKGGGYHLRRIFSKRESEGKNVKMSEQRNNASLTISPDRHVTIPLPQEAGQLRIVFKPLDPLSPQSGEVQFTHFLHPAKHPETETRLFKGSEMIYESTLDDSGGLIEVTSPLHLTLVVTHNQNEITPKPFRLPCWIVLPHDRVAYPLSGNGKDPIPLRLNFILLAGEDAPIQGSLPAKAIVNYRAFDPSGKLLFEGSHDFTPLPAHYIFFKMADFDAQLSESETLYFRLPSTTSRLEISGPLPFLVHAATRPHRLPRLLRAPEDYQRFRPVASRLPGWFGLDPHEKRKLNSEDRLLSLYGLARPPKPNLLLLRRDYVVEEYPPLNQPLGTNLLVSRSLDGFQKKSVATAFSELEPGLVEVEFAANPTGVVSPRLLFLHARNDAHPKRLEIICDGQPLRHLTSSAAFGELGLGPLAPGKHLLQLNGPNQASYFLNQRIPLGDYQRLMFVYRLTEQPMYFKLSKESHEPLNIGGRIFTPSGAAQRTLLEVFVSDGIRSSSRPTSGFTFSSRLFDILPSEKQARLVLGGSPAAVDEGTAFYLSLKEDFPAGEYILQVKRLSGPASHIRVTRLASTLPQRLIDSVPAVAFPE